MGDSKKSDVCPGISPALDVLGAMGVREAAYLVARRFPVVTKAALWAATRPMLAMPPPLRPKGRPLGGLMDAVGYRCPVHCELLNGMRVIVPWNDDQGRSLYDKGVYEPESVRAFTGLLLPGMTVLDVGAHLGQYTLIASDRVSRGGRVYAFEAVPETFRWLKRNVALNDLPNVELVNAAVSDSTEPVTVHLASTRDTGSNSIAGPAWVDSGRKITVPALTLDGYLAEKMIPKVDVVKLDVEGWELPVLRGAEKMLRQMRPRLMVEFEEERQKLAGTSCAELARYLTDRGYRLQRIGAELTDYQPRPDDRSVNVLATPITSSPR